MTVLQDNLSLVSCLLLLQSLQHIANHLWIASSLVVESGIFFMVKWGNLFCLESGHWLPCILLRLNIM